MSQHTPRTMSAERETEIRRIGNGQFTGIADGAVLQALREEFAEIDAERGVSAELLEALKSICMVIAFEPDESLISGLRGAYNKARAAIVKAEPSEGDK